MTRHTRPALSGGVLVALLTVVVLITGLLLTHTNDRVQTCTVTEKDRASTTDGKSSMRVYTEQCGVLEVKDRWVYGRFDAADTYSRIENGSTYRFRTVGHRVPVISMFPVIIAVETAQ